MESEVWEKTGTDVPGIYWRWMKRDGKIKITYSVFVFITFLFLISFYSTRVHSSSWEHVLILLKKHRAYATDQIISHNPSWLVIWIIYDGAWKVALYAAELNDHKWLIVKGRHGRNLGLHSAWWLDFKALWGNQ